MPKKPKKKNQRTGNRLDLMLNITFTDDRVHISGTVKGSMKLPSDRKMSPDILKLLMAQLGPHIQPRPG